MHFSTRLLAGLLLATFALTSPLPDSTLKDKRSFVERDGTNYTIFEHAATGAKIEFVKNSGICETTSGVNQYSGYLTVGTDMNMWFWLYVAPYDYPKELALTMRVASRHAQTLRPRRWQHGSMAALAVQGKNLQAHLLEDVYSQFSSMIGLFQENGPCHFVNGASTPSLNPYSFNSYANMLYIDQPIGVGFSYGTDSVTSTVTAAPYVWKLLQAFYAQFPQYENRNFGIFTESYGGHYGPEFADYFEQQNAANAGEKINLVALGVNNGWFDATLQEKAYISFARNNSYYPIITSDSSANSYLNTYNTQCLPALNACKSSGSNADCQNADNTCYNGIEGSISQLGNYDVYDIRAPSNDPNPPETYVQYLQSAAVVKAIGAKTQYQECPNAPYQQFASTGDNPRSFLPQLSDVIKSGITTVVWAGDADFICNWFGNLDAANAVSWSGQSTFAAKTLAPYNVAGKQGGTFKTQDNFSFLRVFGAGHEVPFYTPQLALQVFKQTMQQQPLSST